MSLEFLSMRYLIKYQTLLETNHRNSMTMWRKFSAWISNSRESRFNEPEWDPNKKNYEINIVALIH